MNTLKTLLTLALLAFALPAGAASANRITLSISVTNLPETGDTLTINAAPRYWTNLLSSTTFETNTTTAGAATNLFEGFISYPYAGNLFLSWQNSTQFNVLAQIGGGLTASESGAWAGLTLSTQAVPRSYPVTVPIGNELSAGQRTNIASQLIADLETFSTNRFSTNSGPLANFARRTNDWIVSPIITNPNFTNAINRGNAFSSPGAGATSEQFGSGATAAGSQGLAVGYQASAAGQYATAVGRTAVAAGVSSTSLGNEATCEAEAPSSVAVGTAAYAQWDNCIAIGATAQALHTNAIVFGAAVQSTASNQVMLGSSSYTVTIPGILSSAINTNSYFKGTNHLNGELSFERTAISTIAAGNNTITLADGVYYISLTGSPGAAFTICAITGGKPGREILIENVTGYAMTIAHQSGFDSEVRRIITPSATDVATTGRIVARLIYNGTTGRWIFVSPTFVYTGWFIPTNALADWPTAPRTPGESYVGNSNGAVYVLTSWPASATWTKTNLMVTP